jgi:hypothetical protein
VLSEDRADENLEHLIASACCVLAASEDVGSITIVANRRLTYQELARVRDHAAPCHVAIAMDGHGTVSVRRRGTTGRPLSIGEFAGENEHGSGDSGTHRDR